MGSGESVFALQQDGRLVGNIAAMLPGQIPAGGKGALVFARHGDLPLGGSTGTLTLRSPQLVDGRTVPTVEVRSRWARGWLLLPLATGIVTAFIVRIFQEHGRTRAEALLRLAQEGQRVDGLIMATPDREQRTLLTAEREKLVWEARRARGSPEEITNKVSEVRTAIHALLAKFADRRSVAQTKLDEWRAAVGILETDVPELGRAVAPAARPA